MSQLVLGVPTLNRYDLLARLISSAELGSLKPTTYLIVDNGGRFEEEARTMSGVRAALLRGAAIVVYSPGKNLGVAASWNELIAWAGELSLIISNDDIELGIDTLQVMKDALEASSFVIANGGHHANGWCLFAQTRSCTELVGPYDESFFPGYYEDSDYERRMQLAGFIPHRVPTEFRHEGWATTRADVTLNEAQHKSATVFFNKWGGLPQDKDLRGIPALGVKAEKRNPIWKRYGYEAGSMRWDVVNYAAELVRARTYLEIGVCNGESIRNVHGVACGIQKFGVDPSPRAGARHACDSLSEITSDELFKCITLPSFDVVFVDGLHHADQAYRDIMNAIDRGAKVVIAHDSNPTTEHMQLVPYAGGDWTGDVWKAIARVRAEGKHFVRTVDSDFGVAMIVPNRGEEVPQMPRDTWEDLQKNRIPLLGLISPNIWRHALERVLRPATVESMIGKWNHWYSESGGPLHYGPDDTYRLAADWLSGLLVEDWGCGYTQFKRFHQGTYVGVDGSGKWADVITDLVTYLPLTGKEPEGILLRHVLDHNENWRKILSNAVASFEKRLVVVLFTPDAGRVTIKLAHHDAANVGDFALPHAELESFFSECRTVIKKEIKNATGYGGETIWLVER